VAGPERLNLLGSYAPPGHERPPLCSCSRPSPVRRGTALPRCRRTIRNGPTTRFQPEPDIRAERNPGVSDSSDRLSDVDLVAADAIDEHVAIGRGNSGRRR